MTSQKTKPKRREIHQIRCVTDKEDMLTMEEIARHMGVSPQRVYQLYLNGLRKIRRYLEYVNIPSATSAKGTPQGHV